MAKKIVFCKSCGAINRVALQGNDQKEPFCGKCSASLEFENTPKTLDSDSLGKVIRNAQLPVIVDIYADWCGPCKTYAPIFEEVSKRKWQDAEFYKVDSEKDPHFSASFNVRGIPTTLIFKDGNLVKSQSGFLNEFQLEELVNNI